VFARGAVNGTGGLWGLGLVTAGEIEVFDLGAANGTGCANGLWGLGLVTAGGIEVSDRSSVGAANGTGGSCGGYADLGWNGLRFTSSTLGCKVDGGGAVWEGETLLDPRGWNGLRRCVGGARGMTVGAVDICCLLFYMSGAGVRNLCLADVAYIAQHKSC